MAKSSRSKWKKAHRRQKAADEAKNVQRRIKQLHKKLKVTIQGGISNVPPQEPEKRFHFLNPELDPNVPNTSKYLNNNYRAELNHVSYDFTKPLKLPKPKTNFYGKSDPTAPHPMTVNRETIDADAPVAGHALTKADMERMEAKRRAQEALANQQESKPPLSTNEEDAEEAAPTGTVQRSSEKKKGKAKRRATAKGEEEEEEALVSFDNDAALFGDADDGPEEYVLTLEEDAKPVRVSTAAGAKRGQAKHEHRIPSMREPRVRKGEVVATAGTKKVKAMTAGVVKTSRMTSSTGKKAKTTGR